MCPPFAAAFNTSGFLVAHVLLMETSSGLILVDTGLGTRDLEAPRQRLGMTFLLASGPRLDVAETALFQIERLGYTARDVRHIVLTHLDLDHAGGLSDFPHAEVHVMGVERQFAFGPLKWRHRTRYRMAQFAHRPRFVDYEGGGERWFGFDAVRAMTGVDAEVLLVPLPGHTLGHAGVAVRDGEQWLLHAGDAYFHHDEILGGSASIVLEGYQRAVAMDAGARLSNRERLVELSGRGTVKIFCAHDPLEWTRFDAESTARNADTRGEMSRLKNAVPDS